MITRRKIITMAKKFGAISAKEISKDLYEKSRKHKVSIATARRIMNKTGYAIPVSSHLSFKGKSYGKNSKKKVKIIPLNIYFRYVEIEYDISHSQKVYLDYKIRQSGLNKLSKSQLIRKIFKLNNAILNQDSEIYSAYDKYHTVNKLLKFILMKLNVSKKCADYIKSLFEDQHLKQVQNNFKHFTVHLEKQPLYERKKQNELLNSHSKLLQRYRLRTLNNLPRLKSMADREHR